MRYDRLPSPGGTTYCTRRQQVAKEAGNEAHAITSSERAPARGLPHVLVRPADCLVQLTMLDNLLCRHSCRGGGYSCRGGGDGNRSRDRGRNRSCNGSGRSRGDGPVASDSGDGPAWREDRQGGGKSDDASDYQDDTDGVDIHTCRAPVYREQQDRTNGHEEDRETDPHEDSPFNGCDAAEHSAITRPLRR